MQEFLKNTIKEAGLLAKSYFDKGVRVTQTKSTLADLLTEADTAVSNFIIKKIREAYPDHAILSEEEPETINAGAEYEWVIDPIDGTRAFANNIPIWCTIIALMKNGETYLGAVYNPLSDQLFFAEKEAGAYLNGQRLQVNDVQQIDHAYGFFARANSAGTYGDHIERYRVLAVNLTTKTDAWVMNIGCMLSVCYLAAGGIDFQIGNAGLDWDYLAPFLIAEEAGAVLTNGYGEPWERGRQDYVLANPELHPKLMKLFEPYQ